eukprot:6155245-Pyramimonas_sp.AAC.1
MDTHGYSVWGENRLEGRKALVSDWWENRILSRVIGWLDNVMLTKGCYVMGRGLGAGAPVQLDHVEVDIIHLHLGVEVAVLGVVHQQNHQLPIATKRA